MSADTNPGLSRIAELAARYKAAYERYEAAEAHDAETMEATSVDDAYAEAEAARRDLFDALREN